jgi:hypothetical protein
MISVEDEELYSWYELKQMKLHDLKVEQKMIGKKQYAINSDIQLSKGRLDFAKHFLSLIEHQTNSDDYPDWAIPRVIQYLQDKGDDFNEDIESLKDTLKRLNSRYRDIDLESNEISFSLKKKGNKD